MKHYPKIVGRPVRSLRVDAPRPMSVVTWIAAFLIGCLFWTAVFAWWLA